MIEHYYKNTVSMKLSRGDWSDIIIALAIVSNDNSLSPERAVALRSLAERIVASTQPKPVRQDEIGTAGSSDFRQDGFTEV